MRETRRRIIEEAVRLFNERGAGAVSTNHIAAGLGMSPGNVYYHFRNKEEIVLEVFGRLRAEAEAGLDRADALPAGRRVREYFSVTLDASWRYRFFFQELPQLLRQDPLLAGGVREWSRSFLLRVEAALEDLERRRLLRRAPGPEARRALALNLWIIGSGWFNYLDIHGLEVTPRTLTQGPRQIFELLRPHATTLGRIAIGRAAEDVARAIEEGLEPRGWLDRAAGM